MAFDVLLKINVFPGETPMRNTQGLDRSDRLLLGVHHGTSMTASSAGGASPGRTILDFTSANTLDKSSTKRLEASIKTPTPSKSLRTAESAETSLVGGIVCK
ncbi:hypothetical protein [Pseudomonas sp. KK4]|uniref:hypothetical protein n=1 Tax=Pseudomonas sp. KK4 TaxID=1855729 RepID=UPI0035304391